MRNKPFFTIFIPTYNRAYCLQNAIESCYKSTFSDFEVIVIDDGSKDDTQALLQKLQSTDFPQLRFEYQNNQGKHVAFNYAVGLARGRMFLTLDSDDTLLPDGLQKIHALWHTLSEQQQQEFVGIEFRCLENGKPSSAYPEPYLDSTYVAKRRVCETLGEHRSAYRLDVLKNYAYPVFAGERYCRPGLIDIRIAKNYKTRFSNIIAIDAGHFPDGIGANRRKIIVSAPMAYRQYFLEEITQHASFNTKRDLRSFYKRFARCSFNAGVSVKQQYLEAPDKMLYLLIAAEAFVGSLSDRMARRG